MLPTEKETQGTVKLCDTCTRHLQDFLGLQTIRTYFKCSRTKFKELPPLSLARNSQTIFLFP